ncbi:MAG: type II secretion system GspH family protein [Thermoguttaceae bacterium]|nr:type II secretion system GspH family protein [Thermoguttaceae bacterium]MDW8038977.1 prepilin-type N-terminal cleavage/methylation domain-containing protein [Thermoguttaceae bacterium]
MTAPILSFRLWPPKINQPLWAKIKQPAFSLLEVILALTILGVSLAVLGELARWGLRHAGYVRDMTQAQLLCESKMSEIVTGIVWPEPAVNVPFAAEDLLDPNDPVGWVYSIELAETDQPGLLAVAVTVSQNLPPERKPVQCTLVRWIPNPGIEGYDIATEAASEALQNQQTQSSGTTTLSSSPGGTTP